MTFSRPAIMSGLLALFICVTGTAANDSYVAPTDPAQVRPLTVGSDAPAFTVRRPTGEVLRFDPKSLERPTLLIFYRGGWCPYCNAHLGQLRTVQPTLLEMGYDVLFLSADRPERLIPSLKEKDLLYTIVSDAEMNASRAFGIAFRVDDATVANYKKWNIDLEKASGQTHHELPVPAVFIVDRGGVIRFAHWNPDYKVRIDPQQLLTAARSALRAD